MSKPSYRLDEIAAEWDCSIWTIRRLIRSDKLKAFKVGRSYRITDSERMRFESLKDFGAVTSST